MAKKIPPVTKEEWNEVNEDNKNIVEEYLDSFQGKQGHGRVRR